MTSKSQSKLSIGLEIKTTSQTIKQHHKLRTKVKLKSNRTQVKKKKKRQTNLV